jgi:hypothetical protein
MGGKMDINLNDFYTKKHQRLSLIAATANVFSWLVIFFFLILTISNFVGFFRIQDTYQIKRFFEIEPAGSLNIILEMGQSLFHGGVYFLILRGIALGMQMIIETDLNYREATREGAK